MTLSPELEMQLREMGVMPTNWLEDQSVVFDTKHIYPDLLDKSYFNDPRNENGEANF